MKTNLTFRSLCLALLMVMLIFSHPFVILAQQNSAEIQAKQDAKADLNNKLSWEGVGCAVWSLPVLGYLVGSFGDQSSPDGVLGMSDQQACGWSVGLLASGAATWGTLVLIETYRLTPPPERLIGKTPEYVDVYTDAYKKRIRRLRLKHVSMGCIAGAVGGSIWVTAAAEFREQ